MRCAERFGGLAAALALYAGALPVHAALDEPVGTIAAEQVRLGAERRVATGARLPQVHTLQWRDGSAIRQYAGADGVVFAVAWNTRTKPRLDLLLGRHFDGYRRAAAREADRAPGARHHRVLGEGDLVVESTVNGHAHVGRAFLRSRWPATGEGDAIR